MMYLIIFLPFYFIVAGICLYRTIQQKEFRYFLMQIPLFAVTLVLNVMFAVEFPFPSISSIFIKLLSNFVK